MAGRKRENWGGIEKSGGMPAWKARQGRVEGADFSRGARCPLPHVLPQSLAWTPQPGDIPELGLGRQKPAFQA